MLDIAFHLSQEKLETRVAPWSATLNLIIDYFSTKPLIRLLGREPIKIIPTSQEDCQTLSGKIPMADLVLNPARPMHSSVVNNAAYIQWLNDNLPSGVGLSDFDDLIFLVDQIIYKWGKRREIEERMIRGVGLIARFIAHGTHVTVLYTIWMFYQAGHIQSALLLGLALLLAMGGIAISHNGRNDGL